MKRQNKEEHIAPPIDPILIYEELSRAFDELVLALQKLKDKHYSNQKKYRSLKRVNFSSITW